MADNQNYLDRWRRLFGRAGAADIFEVLEHAILIAASDRPREFQERRDQIVEKLYSAALPHCFQSNAAAAAAGGGEESQVAGEVLKIKETLVNQQEQSETALLESLARLQSMQLTVEILQETEIGKAVNGLRKHSSKQIRAVVRTLIEGWKDLVDKWVKATTTPTAGTKQDKSPVSTNPPMEDGDRRPSLIAVQPSSIHPPKKNLKCSQQDKDAKMELTKHKLHEGYQKIENAKKQRTVKVVEELPDVPKPRKIIVKSRTKIRS